MNGTIPVYPGSFDPITNGHLDIIRRALRIFDRLIVAVGCNPGKQYLFDLEERVAMIREAVGEDPRVEVEGFQGLLVDYLERKGAYLIIRGLRALSDFEYEFQMALMNRKLNRRVETLFLMTGYRWFYTSSSLVRQVASVGGSVRGLVPEVVHRRLAGKIPQYAERNFNR